MSTPIKIKGARIHNLKNIDIEIPKNKLTVITGVSGSGKSSLAFDTLYEEGRRRYLMFSNTVFDDISTSAESITGLSPTVAVEQRVTRQSNPRSTVGTRTKIGNMLSAFFAMYGSRPQEYDDGLPLSMEMFQKNSPKGMCVRCLGAGKIFTVDEDMLFSDNSITLLDSFRRTMSLVEGTRDYSYHSNKFVQYCNKVGFDPHQTVESLDENQLLEYKYGGNGYNHHFNGLIPWVTHLYDWMFRRKRNDYTFAFQCVTRDACPRCGGSGLGIQATHTTISGKTFGQMENMYISDLYEYLRQDKLADTTLLRRILINLKCLMDVGLHHLALARPLPTLSGGEIQRLFLASYIIAEMDSIIFIFDEPTIGLHEVEKQKLIDIIQNIVQRGNTVVAVEHDKNFMQMADYVIDLGPQAGIHGGEKIFQGSYEDFVKSGRGMTAPYLNGTLSLPVKSNFKPVTKTLILSGCNIHNLQNVSVEIPLGMMVGVAGVSGSGKSSIIADTLVPKLKELLQSNVIDESDNEDDATTISSATLSGVEHIKKCLVVDQKPIGRSRTSCPATYTGIFDRVRKMFATSPEAATQGFSPGMFSVNAEGKCPRCGGNGYMSYHVGEGNFIYTDCENCGGTGFRPETMTITVDGKNIKDILNMSITEAAQYFADKNKSSYQMLQTLDRVGLGYMKLGQQTPTISGGEAQRLKLAKELGKSNPGKNNVYILDEPTTGLSFADSAKLIALMQELVDNGNTVIITEHDPALLSNCDYIVEMGPGGGSDGGYVLATGTPTELKCNEKSIIGRYLL